MIGLRTDQGAPQCKSEVRKSRTSHLLATFSTNSSPTLLGVRDRPQTGGRSVIPAFTLYLSIYPTLPNVSDQLTPVAVAAAGGVRP